MEYEDTDEVISAFSSLAAWLVFHKDSKKPLVPHPEFFENLFLMDNSERFQRYPPDRSQRKLLSQASIEHDLRPFFQDMSSYDALSYLGRLIAEYGKQVPVEFFCSANIVRELSTECKIECSADNIMNLWFVFWMYKWRGITNE